VTHEHSLPALEAAHIRPFAEEGTHEVSNGLLLRSDIHRLFDKGYVGVTPEYRFVVSKSLKEDFENGKSYYPLHGRETCVPGEVGERPSGAMLEWHLGERFSG
jgi:putative restriction endonuclease